MLMFILGMSLGTCLGVIVVGLCMSSNKSERSADLLSGQVL